MDSARKTRTRTPDRRPPPAPDQPEAPNKPTGNHLCPHCPAWVEATWVDGELIEVVIQHRWMPCQGRRDQQDLAHWRGNYENVGIPHSWVGAYAAPPDRRPPPRPNSRTNR